MNIQEHTTPEKLEKYAFLWSEVRLVVAALALFLGGIPPVTFLPLPSGLVGTLLGLSWIISGLAVGYLAFNWLKSKMLFGAKEKLDMYAFFVMIVSGLNLGIAGLFRTNIGLNITSAKLFLWIVGALYLASAYHLYRRWKAHNERVF